MDLLDANILIGAFRPDDPDHAILKGWLEETLNKGLSVTFPALVEVAFLRIVTHPKIFNIPSPLEEAVGFLAGHQRERSVPGSSLDSSRPRTVAALVS